MGSQKRQVGDFLASCFLIQWEFIVLAPPSLDPPTAGVLRGQREQGKASKDRGSQKLVAVQELALG